MAITRTRLEKLAEEKRNILDDFRKIRIDIIELVSRFPSEQVNTAFIGSWSILDLLAHLCGWDYTNLQAAQDILQGRLPAFYAQRDKDWQTYNAGLVRQYKQDNLSAMLQALNVSHSQLTAYLEQLTTEQFMTDQGVRHGNYKVIISRLIVADTKDVRKHLDQIQGYM